MTIATVDRFEALALELQCIDHGAGTMDQRRERMANLLRNREGDRVAAILDRLDAMQVELARDEMNEVNAAAIEMMKQAKCVVRDA